MKTVAFFNGKEGIGTTLLVYHVAWMMALIGVNVLVIDLDPQAKATNLFLAPEDVEQLFDNEEASTVHRTVQPLIRGVGDVEIGAPVQIGNRLHLVAGDLSLAEMEDPLSEAWRQCLARDGRAFRMTTALSCVIQGAGARVGAEVALIDPGPNLGAVNRAALIASDYVVVPLSADLFAIRGLSLVGSKLGDWRQAWSRRKPVAPTGLGLALPNGAMEPLGYVIWRYSVWQRWPTRALHKWLDRAPGTFRSAMGLPEAGYRVTIEEDSYNLGQLKDYRPLMSMAQEASKPIFLLKPADGALGGHQAAVTECYWDFKRLVSGLLQRIGVSSLSDL